MPVPFDPNIKGAVLHDTEANPIDSVIRADGRRALVVDGAGGAGVGEISGNVQVQTLETTVALGGNATFNGTEHDNIKYEAFGVSITLVGGPAPTTVTVNFQQRHVGTAVFRNADSIVLNVGAGETINFNRVWSVTRQFGRIQLINNTPNFLVGTEVITMRKPIS